MFKNYLKIAWRNLMKSKTYTGINLLGLSVAFAVAILLSMAAFFDLSFENFHENGNKIYKVYTIQQTPKGQEAGTSQPTPFAKALQSEVPGISKITRILQDGALTSYGEKDLNLDGLWVDSDFFSMFTFPVSEGSQTNILQELSSVVITERTAEKLFGSTKGVGKTVNIQINGKERPFTVATIVTNMPRNTSMDFEIAIRFENNAEYAQTREAWNAQYHEVFVQLENGMEIQQFEKNTRDFVNLHYQETIENAKGNGVLANDNGLFRELKLLALSDVRFASFRKGFANVSRSVPFLFLGIAFLILFIACVNFINMSIAKSTQRLKEIGMRKALGAKRKQLFFQFWSESLIIFLAAMSIGIAVSALLLNDFKTIFRTGASLDIFTSPIFIIGFLSIILLITLVVGGYPALLLSRMGTIQSLKGKIENNGKNRLRDGLIIVQFSIAILLITGTLVLQGQIDFMRNKDLGYNKDQVISFPLNGKKNSYAALNLLKQELQGNPEILQVSGADNNLGRGKDGSQSSSAIGFDYKGRSLRTNFLVIDYEYVPTLGIEITMGRSFNSPADSLGVLINEALALELGEADPLSASINHNGDLQSPVLGVVKDYHFQDLDRAIEPLIFVMTPDLELTYAYVKVGSKNIASSFQSIEDAWQKIEPSATFLGSFLDENVDRTFQREKSMATIVTSGSIIAIVLSCIGLFAMSMLVVLQRTKEIGIRKVIGASVLSITYLLTKDFLKLVLLAFLIASPIAWWFLNEWLQNYAYRIQLSPWFFVAAGLLAIVIAVFTISTRSVSAAIANPVKSLRSE